MKKITLLTSALTLVTASLLASCGSTGGNDGHYTPPNATSSHSSSVNQPTNTNNSSTQTGNQSTNTDNQSSTPPSHQSEPNHNTDINHSTSTPSQPADSSSNNTNTNSNNTDNNNNIDNNNNSDQSNHNTDQPPASSIGQASFSTHAESDPSLTSNIAQANASLKTNYANVNYLNTLNLGVNSFKYDTVGHHKSPYQDSLEYQDNSYYKNYINNYVISNFALDLDVKLKYTNHNNGADNPDGPPPPNFKQEVYRHTDYYQSYPDHQNLSPVYEQSFWGHFRTGFKPADIYVPSLAVISSGFKPTTAGHYFKEVKTLDLTTIDPKFTAPASTNNHLGFYSSFISSGQALTLSKDNQEVKASGIQPISTVIQADLDLGLPQTTDKPTATVEAQIAQIDKIYQHLVATNHPTVITTSLATSLTDPYTQDHPNYFQPKYEILASSIKATTSNPQTAPLFVFSAGNYTHDQYQQALTTEYQQATNKDAYLQATLANPNSGLQLDKNSDLAKLTANTQLNPYFIVATGVSFDQEGDSSNLKDNLASTAQVLDQASGKTFSSQVDTLAKNYLDTTLQANTAKDQYYYNSHLISKQQAPVLSGDTVDLRQHQFPNQGYVFSPVGSFQCGASAFNCLAAPYSYYQPFNKNGADHGLVKGTEYAAAYISGAALLVKQKFPWMTASNLKTTLLTTATDAGAVGIDPVFGWGVLNVNAALQGPSQLAFGEFKADFNLDPRNEQTESKPSDVIKLFTTDPWVDQQPLTQVSQHLNLYDFSSVNGQGGLTVTHSGAKLTSGLRIVYAGYQGATQLDHAVLVLENPTYRQDILYSDSYLNQYVAKDYSYFPKAPRPGDNADPNTAHLPKIIIVNEDQDSHPDAYYNRINLETKAGGTYESYAGSYDEYNANNNGNNNTGDPNQGFPSVSLPPNLAHAQPSSSSSITQTQSTTSTTDSTAATSSPSAADSTNMTSDSYKAIHRRKIFAAPPIDIPPINFHPGSTPLGQAKHDRIADDPKIYNFSDAAEQAYAQQIANRHLTAKDYSFHSPITIGTQGILVSNLPEIDTITNNGGYYLPYSFITYGEYGGYLHTAPYRGSLVHNFTQTEQGTLVVGLGLKSPYPYQHATDLSNHTVVSADNTHQKVMFHYYSDGEYLTSAHYYYYKPFARNDQVVSTTVFADTATVAGKAQIYFNFGGKLAHDEKIKTQEDQPPVSVTNYHVPYIPTSGLILALVSAKHLSGTFSQVSFVDSGYVNTYNLSPVTLMTNFGNQQTYGQSLVVKITPKTLTDRVTAASGTSVLDTTLVRSAAKTVDTIYKLADQQYFGANHNQAHDHQNYLALASAAQSSDNQNFRTFLYQNALTVYPDLQLATTQNSHSQVNNFIDRVANNYLHHVSHQVYFDYNYKQTNWTSPTSAIFGSDKVHNLSLGYYGQSYGLNYGLAGLVNYGTWNEDLTSLNADLDHLQLANLTNLASAKTITAGLVATIGKAQARSFYAINLSANFHNYDLTRNLLFLTETTKFNALDFELAGRYGYSLYHTDHSRFSVIGGLSLVDNYRLAVKETASINPTKLEQITGNTDAKAVAAQFKYTSLDAKAHNALNMYASVALAYTYNFKVLNFNQALSVQGKAERVLNDLNFNINSNSNGSNLASTSVFNNNYIITAKATYQVNFTTNLKLDLYAAYTFCQNWQDKTAGTALSYSF